MKRKYLIAIAAISAAMTVTIYTAASGARKPKPISDDPFVAEQVETLHASTESSTESASEAPAEAATEAEPASEANTETKTEIETVVHTEADNASSSTNVDNAESETDSEAKNKSEESKTEIENPASESEKTEKPASDSSYDKKSEDESDSENADAIFIKDDDDSDTKKQTDSAPAVENASEADTEAEKKAASNTDAGKNKAEKTSAASAEKKTMHSIWQGTLNIRSGAGTNYAVIGGLTYQQTVTVTGTKNGWYIIDYLGKQGYVYSKYLQSGEGTSANVGASVPAKSSKNGSVYMPSCTADINNPSNLSLIQIVDENAYSAETAAQKRFHDMIRNGGTGTSSDAVILYDDGTAADTPPSTTGWYTFGTLTDARDFIDFVTQNYGLFGQGDSGPFSYNLNTDGSISILPHADTNRAATMQTIVNAIGTSHGQSQLETVQLTMQKVYTYLTYSNGAEMISMDSAIAQKVGVCYHYSHAAYVLLNYEGVPTRIVAGMHGGGMHSWLETTIDGTVYTIDPTNDALYKGRPSDYVECPVDDTSIFS